MSQSHITFDEVKIVADALSARGERPTISRVKEELGGRGSSITISAFLRQWRGEDVNDSPSLLTVEHVDLSTPHQHQKHSPPPDEPIAKHTEPTVTHTPITPPPMEADAHFGKKPEKEYHPSTERPPREQRRNNFDRHHKQGNRSGDRQPFRERNNHRGGHQGSNHHSTASPAPVHAQHTPQGSETNNPGMQDYVETEKTQSTPISYWAQYDYVFHGDLAEKSDRELEIIIRRMEALLGKEQSRRETAEKLFEETKEYATAIRKQVADHINDIRLMHDTVVAGLKAEARELKISAEKDLMFYRDQLGKANQKIVELIKGVSAESPEKEEPKEQQPE